MVQYITQHRRGTKEEWANSKEIPYEAEIVVELDEVTSQHKLKIGDGTTPYEDLGYLQAGGSDVTQAVARQATITLYVNEWQQHADKRWYQTVEVVGTTITAQDKVDLQPSPEQLSVFHKKDLAFVTENNNGVVSVYCVGQVPQDDCTMQVTVLSVAEIVSEVIVGNTTTTPVPNEIYVGDGDMPEDATLQFVLDDSDEDLTQIPTKTSDLENDSGFITEDEVPSEIIISDTDEDPDTIPDDASVQIILDDEESEGTLNDYIDAQITIKIPTKVSVLENDLKYVNEEYVTQAINTAFANIKRAEDGEY